MMPKHNTIFLMICLLACCQIVFSKCPAGQYADLEPAPTPAYLKYFRGSGNAPTAIASDSFGNTYVGGVFSGPTWFGDFGLDSAGANKDIYIVKYNYDGIVLWATRIAGSMYDEIIKDIAVDSSGNVFVVGEFSGTVQFDSIQATGSSDAFVAKFYTNGAVAWVRTGYGSTGYTEVANAVTVGPDGSCIIVGSFGSSFITFGSTTQNGKGAFIFKFLADGTCVWSGVTSSANPVIASFTSVAIDGNTNEIVAVGQYQKGPIQYGSKSLPFVGSTDNYFVSKFRFNGTLVWLVKGCPGIINDVVVGKYGRIYATGHISSTVTIGSTTLTHRGSTDMLFVSYFSDGTVQFAKNALSTGSDSGMSITADRGGEDMVITGYYIDSISFMSISLEPVSGYNTFVVKFSTDLLQAKWAIRAQSASYNRGLAIISAFGDLFIAGSFTGQLTIGSYSVTSPHYSFTFVVKLEPPCLLCDAGKNSSKTGETSSVACQSCPSGTYAANRGTALCSACDPGTYVPWIGATSCKVCQAGTYSGTYGSKTCSGCEPGTFSSTRSTACVPCSAGYYIGQYGAAFCYPCSAGMFSTIGSRYCTYCPPGSYSNVDRTNCSLCPAGTYLSTIGGQSISFCTPCPAGTFAPHTGSSSCLPCPAGSYSNIRNTSCTLCPFGTYSSAASDSCRSCSIGTYSLQNGATTATVCLSCPAGQYSPSISSACKSCPAGTFSIQGSTECVACPRGTFSAVSSNDCLYCPAGTFGTTIASSNCSACPSGTYAVALGATTPSVCQKCPSGTYSTVSGANSISHCLQCAAGTYSSDIGASSDSTCAKCPTNTYSSITGATSVTACIPCASGLFATPGSTVCTSAPQTSTLPPPMRSNSPPVPTTSAPRPVRSNSTPVPTSSVTAPLSPHNSLAQSKNFSIVVSAASANMYQMFVVVASIFILALF